MFQEKAFFRNLPLLETPRLFLRKLVLEDAHDMFRYAQDPEVARFVLWSRHLTLSDSVEHIRAVLSNYRDGKVAEWGVVEKHSNRLIGTCGFVAVDAENDRAEIGYALGQAWWGKGLMTEAVQAVMRLAFRQLRLNRLEARCVVSNLASQRLLEKVGMRYEGLQRQLVKIDGHYQDVKLYGILYADYQAAMQAGLNPSAISASKP